MRASSSILVLMMLVLACRPRRESTSSPDEQMRTKLAGVWVGVQKYASGHDVMNTMEVTSDGTCTTKLSIPERKVGPRTIEQTGTWRLEDGVLVETITSDSQTNARVPDMVRFKILRIDDHELELDVDRVGGLVYPTNRFIFTKQTR